MAWTTCTSEAVTFYTIFHGGIRTYVNNYLTNASTPLASQTRNTYGLANNYQSPRDVRFGFRFSTSKL